MTMQLSDFQYQLPDDLIARYPLQQRSASRLLHLNHAGAVIDSHIAHLDQHLKAGDLLIFNDTRVMKARLLGHKTSGGAVEILVERVIAANQALAHVKSSNSPKVGSVLSFADGALSAEILGRKDNLFILQFSMAVIESLEQYGLMPIPPYFQREAEDSDDERYQTVFHHPEKTASVAAPTASLHFDHELLARLQDKAIEHAFVTLHVGAGTFQPIRAENITEHQMHSEWGEVEAATVAKITAAKARGNNVIAVGTTATRALESAAKANNGVLAAWQGETDIFIYPGYRFQVIDRLITNFHLPASTLLLLVSALAGREPILKAYQHAIEQKYRFFSYGDAMLIDKSSDEITA